MMVWVLGHQDLRLSDAEFWRLTPRQFVALLERHRELEQLRDHRFGVIAATIANANRDSSKNPDPFTSADFFSSLAEEDDVSADQTQTVEQQIAIVENLNALFGGVDLRKKAT